MSCKLCSIYYNDRNRLPKLIPECGDTFCLHCINQMIRCHVCQQTFDRTKCITNKEMLQTAIKLKKGKNIDQKINICFGGASSVGKTSLINRLKGEDFSPLKPTVGIETAFINKQIEGYNVQLIFWDPSGQERFGSITRQFYQKCDIFVFVYNLSASPENNNLDFWIQQVQEYCPKSPMKIVVGNQSDTVKDKSQAKPLNIDTVEKLIDMRPSRVNVSCKTYQGIQELWQILDIHVVQHIQTLKNRQKESIRVQREEQRRNLQNSQQQETQRELVRLRNENRELHQRKKRCQC